MKFIVKEIKGYSYRLINIEDNCEYRLLKRDAYDGIVLGSLITANVELSGKAIMEIELLDEIVGDSSKNRVEVCTDDYKLGDLIDGVPIVNFGRSYAKNGKKMAYAYFK